MLIADLLTALLRSKCPTGDLPYSAYNAEPIACYNSAFQLTSSSSRSEVLMSYRFPLALLLMTLGFGIAGAQTCQTVVIPVNPISATGHTFRGLSAEDFVLLKGSGQVKSLTFDDGPRRVLVVVDTSSKLRANTRR